MILERGTLLNNRYQIVEILGQGGMGSVYRAVDENLGMEVAVKDNLFTTEEYARQFRREAIILANLRHPNLPRVTDHFVITGQGQYLVMDYIEGEDLRQRMDRVGVLPEEEVIIIGAAVCDALSYLGSRKPSIIHRDIKPGNIKITPQGHIFLVDFGLAKTLQGSQATTTGARAMTPGYSPPEQYGTARTDQRSDIFSLGATLYAALTNATPEDALSRAMDQAELTSIRKHNLRVSRRLASVLEKALEVRPDDRFQTADDFKQALLSASAVAKRREGDYSVTPPPEDGDEPAAQESAILQVGVAEEELVRAESVSPEAFAIDVSIDELDKAVPQPIARRPARPRRWNCLAALLVVLVLLAVTSEVIYLASPSLFSQALDRVEPLILALFATPTQIGDVSPGSTLTWTPFFTDTLTPSPEPTFTSTAVASPTITLAPTDTPIPTDTLTPLPTPLGGGGQIAFASDSTGTNQIYIVNVDGTGREQVTDLPEGACQPSWSPDGKRLVFTSPCYVNKDYYPGSALFIINADGEGFVPLPASVNGDYDPAWSPTSNKIAYTSLQKSGRPQVYVIDLDKDEAITLLSDEYDYASQPTWSPDGKKIMYVSSLQGVPALWIMDADGGNKQQFSRSAALMNIRPDWGPDGQKVVFTQLVAAGGIPKLVLAPFDIENYVEIRVSKDAIPMREGVFSPDGHWIAFESWEVGGNHDIYVITSSGAGRRPITSDPRTDFDAAWKPIP